MIFRFAALLFRSANAFLAECASSFNMTPHKRMRPGCVVVCVLAGLLTACGGGGGGPSSSPTGPEPAPIPSTPDGAWLSFDPAAPSASQNEGTSVAINLTATSSRTFSSPFNVAIVDANGVVTTQVEVAAFSQLSYRATLHTNAGLAPGDHSTVLEVRVCEDAPLTCARPFPGSPWRVPLKVQVKSKAEAASHLTLSVPSLSATTYPGEAVPFSFSAQLDSTLNGQYGNIGVVDPGGLTSPSSGQLITSPDGRYVFNLSTTTVKTLQPGTYTSNLELRMCQDQLGTCRAPIFGTPWIVPLTVTVKSPTNLTPLQAIDGLGAWSTYQGNPGHTGFVAASFDPAVFTRRWQLVPGQTNFTQRYPSAAIDNGRVFFAQVKNSNNYSAQLVAVSEDSGQILWTVDLGHSLVNAPATGNGHVYVVTVDAQTSFLWVFNQADGTVLRKVEMGSQYGDFSAPTVLGTDVYFFKNSSGTSSGAARFSDQSGTINWGVNGAFMTGWTPSTDGRFIYTYDPATSSLLGYSTVNVSTRFTIGTGSSIFSEAAGAVVLADDQLAIVAGGSLMAFDLSRQTRAWAMNVGSWGTPAYGNGTVYAFNADGTVLEAHDPKTGNLLWTSPSLTAGSNLLLIDSEKFSNVIVTRNLAFVSSSFRTLAIDLSTHQIVWNYPQGGGLAISPRGVLMILDAGRTLAAVNLR